MYSKTLFLKPQPIEEDQKRILRGQVHKSNNKTCFDVLQINIRNVSIRAICTTIIKDDSKPD